MYTRQEASKQRQAFWTTFGQYMQPILSADGDKVNWINYKTGVPGVHFKMDADSDQATVAIVLSQPDADVRLACYNQFLQLKNMMQNIAGEEWEWLPKATDEYSKETSRIGTTLSNVNIYKNNDWPQLISFFKSRIIALDQFWSMAKYGFQ